MRNKIFPLHGYFLSEGDKEMFFTLIDFGFYDFFGDFQTPIFLFFLPRIFEFGSIVHAKCAAQSRSLPH